MLKKLNYIVVSVAGGEEAVEYLKQNAVDLVVLDMIMDPGMDGLDTYSKILEIYPHQRAIIVSGFSETERVNRAQALGAGAYVKKPYILEKLGLAVRNELDQPARTVPHAKNELRLVISVLHRETQFTWAMWKNLPTRSALFVILGRTARHLAKEIWNLHRPFYPDSIRFQIIHSWAAPPANLHQRRLSISSIMTIRNLYVIAGASLQRFPQ